MTLELDELGVVKGGATILKSISATFPPNMLTVIAGPNGAGKSTLLRAMAGLEPLATGRVTFAGKDLTALKPHERAKDFAWAPSEADLPFAFTVRDSVVMGRFPWHQGTPLASDFAAADRALARLGLSGFARRSVQALSSGERSKVLVARALAGDARHLLFDEPTANLDVGAALRLLNLLREVSRAGRTVIVTLHDLSLGCRSSDHALCLHLGRIAKEGRPDTVFAPDVLGPVFDVEVSRAVTSKGAPSLLFDIPGPGR